MLGLGVKSPGVRVRPEGSILQLQQNSEFMETRNECCLYIYRYASAQQPGRSLVPRSDSTTVKDPGLGTRLAHYCARD